MPALTDTEIRRAIQRVHQTRKQENLADGDGKGTGRLVLILKPMPTRVTSDWMAQQYAGGRRTKRKLGAYPSMSLGQAREVFDRDFAPVIQRGGNIRLAADTRSGTVAELFEAYVGHLQEAGKVSWRDAEKSLQNVAELLGPRRPARDIDSREIVEAIRPIYRRGSKAMADHVRGYVRAAYSWGMKAEHDYRTKTPRRFGITVNPAASIPTEPKNVGARWLDEGEFVRLYRWLEAPDVRLPQAYSLALRVLMLTGQRVQEIAALHVDQWDENEQVIDWSRTKNGRPHAIPVPGLAAELLRQAKPGPTGWLFPSASDRRAPVAHQCLYSVTWRQRERGVIPMATNRDLRRTWKTLAGMAGLSKEIRDRIQNHALHDVGSKNYDRWSYMPEKRAAMARWDEFVRALLVRQART